MSTRTKIYSLERYIVLKLDEGVILHFVEPRRRGVGLSVVLLAA